MAALTAGTVPVEATRRSRALVALGKSITMGRPAMAVPVTSVLSVGGHQALREHWQARLASPPAGVE